MPEPASAIILGFAYLAVKHTAADFFLQTPYQYTNKGRYAHPGGLLHAAIHAGLTAPVFFILAPASGMIGAAILLAEFAIHYHVDWAKEQLTSRNELSHSATWYWRILGVDQLLHSLTCVVIIAILAGAAGA